MRVVLLEVAPHGMMVSRRAAVFEHREGHRVLDALPLLEGVLKEHSDFVEARVLLASVYYRLNRKEDGDRQKELIQKSNADQQAKQPK